MRNCVSRYSRILKFCNITFDFNNKAPAKKALF